MNSCNFWDMKLYFFPWRYGPNLGLGLPPWNSPFHLGLLDLKTFGRTPWAGDQLVAMPWSYVVRWKSTYVSEEHIASFNPFGTCLFPPPFSLWSSEKGDVLMDCVTRRRRQFLEVIALFWITVSWNRGGQSNSHISQYINSLSEAQSFLRNQ
jgi:hypothetical protein